MKIFVNELCEICALYENATGRDDLTELEVEREELGTWCDLALFGFKYEPSYAYDSEKDEYILDKYGNKIQAGYAFYPFIDSNIIMSIQNLYEQEMKPLKSENADLQTELTNTQLALTEQYEENLALQEEATNTQLALCEIYEGMEVTA